MAQIRERTIPESHQSSHDDDTDSNDEDQMGDDDVAHRMFEENVNESIESVQAQIFDDTLTAAGYEQHIENTIETFLARMRAISSQGSEAQQNIYCEYYIGKGKELCFMNNKVTSASAIFD